MNIFSIWLVLFGCGDEGIVDNDTDYDNDGFEASVDCNDNDAAINPDADEVCDGFDNNCDDEIDEATATDAGTWYADFDLDSYGDANTSMIACEMPEGYVEDGTDCDDTSELVSPNGTEVCDGLDNDCDASTYEDGMATHTSADGVANDVTADVSGTDGAPAEFTVSDGALHFCDGTFYVNLTVDGDATVGSFNEDPTQAILDGGGVGRPVFVGGEGLTVGVMDLTLQNGFAPEDSGMEFDAAGGGVFCTADSEASEFVANDMNLDNVMITGNTAEAGGGMFSFGCNLTINNSEISGNTSFVGGGIISFAGNHSLMAVDIVDNESTAYSAGGFSSGIDSSDDSLDAYTVILTDVVVTGNVNTDSAGVLAIVGNTTATWNGTTGAEGSGIWGNTSPGFGALELIDGGQLFAATVDFGSYEAGTGNTDFDVTNNGATGDTSDYWVARDDATFSCDEFGCGTPVATVILDPSAANGQEELDAGWLLAAPFTVDSTGTLESVDLYSIASDSGCDVEFMLLSSETALADIGEDPIEWMVEWQSSTALSTSPEWVNSGTIGQVLDDSLLYAFSWYPEGCSMGISFFVPEDGSENPAVSIQGLGVMHPGNFWVADPSNIVGDVGDSLSLEPGYWPLHFNLSFNVTQL